MKFEILRRIAVLLVLVAFILGKEQGCGGIFEGDNGKFRYFPHEAVVDRKNPQNCVWLVHVYAATTIQLTLDEFLPAVDNNTVIFYPEKSPGTDLAPIPLNAQSVGSTLTFPGSTVIIILPESSSYLAFTWDSTLPAGFDPNDIATLADYIQVPEGQLTWTPARRQEQLWWIIGTEVSANVEWSTQVDLSDCDRTRPCSCFSFEAFELSIDGYLLEVSRTCGRSSSGMFKMQSSTLVIAASAITTQRGASKVELHWVEDLGSSITTSHPVKTTPAITDTTIAPPEPSIYFTTDHRGLSAFSVGTNTVDQIVNSTENFLGITYDPINDKLFWSTFHKIYQSNKDGSGMETVLNTTEYGNIYGLAFDWIGMNIYVTTSAGFILACDGGAKNAFNCSTLFDGQRVVYGIALDPIAGMMYWTRSSAGSIHKAGMDGSSPLTLFTGLNVPAGVTIDFASERLYWTEEYGQKIQASDLDGQDIQLVLQLPAGSYPWGIAVWNDRIYWGNNGNYKLQSCAKDGQDIQTLYTETDKINGVTVVPDLDQRANRWYS